MTTHSVVIHVNLGGLAEPQKKTVGEIWFCGRKVIFLTFTTLRLRIWGFEAVCSVKVKLSTSDVISAISKV